MNRLAKTFQIDLDRRGVGYRSAGRRELLEALRHLLT